MHIKKEPKGFWENLGTHTNCVQLAGTVSTLPSSFIQGVAEKLPPSSWWSYPEELLELPGKVAVPAAEGGGGGYFWAGRPNLKRVRVPAPVGPVGRASGKHPASLDTKMESLKIGQVSHGVNVYISHYTWGLQKWQLF